MSKMGICGLSKHNLVMTKTGLLKKVMEAGHTLALI